MKRVSLATVANISDLLDMAGEDTILLETPEGREFILAEVDDFDTEIDSVRRNQDLLDLLDERSRETERHSLAEVRKKLGLG
ncbi:MAG TPA: hypothetical protein VLQ45_08700 [Thermoanaerobaculia bacterium]|jgi:hypothetical protein|nr:hypothetical protein [Thermoanaerobaculia bacterium]